MNLSAKLYQYAFVLALLSVFGPIVIPITVGFILFIIFTIGSFLGLDTNVEHAFLAGALIPPLQVLAIVSGALAVSLSVKATKQTSSQTQAHKGLLIASIIIGVIGIAYNTYYLFFFKG